MNAFPHRAPIRPIATKNSFFGISALFLVFAFLLAPLRANSQSSSFAGVVVENTCNAQIQEPAEATWKKIGPTRGVPRPLLDGERVMCSPHTPGSVTVLVSKIYKSVSGGEIYRVEMGTALTDVVNYSDLAATRGASYPSTIFTSPSSEGAVDPQNFVVRWTPPARIGEVLLAIAPKSGGDGLFSIGHISGSSGSFDSQPLRDALEKYRDRGGLDPLVLRLHDEAGQDYAVTFTVLTPPDQKKLARELAEWDSQSGIVQHLGRASVFSSLSLYSEAAAESELALKESPQSPLLLQLAANAELRTGNSARAGELEKQFSQLTAKAR